MLSLDSPRWAQLNHAYGSASDIPSLLLRLREFPSSEGDAEPWFTLWSSLAHQGDVYSASFAAVPHVVETIASAPERVDPSYFHFPAWVEICRAEKGIEVPEDLRSAYFESLARLPSLVAAVSTRSWTPDFLVCALAAIAAVKAHPIIAEAVLELESPEVAEKFMQSIFEA